LLIVVGVLWLVTVYLRMFTDPGDDSRPIDVDPFGIFLLLAVGVAPVGAGLYRLRQRAGRPSLVIAVLLNLVVLGLSVLLILGISLAHEGFGPAGFTALVIACGTAAYLVMMLIAPRTHSAARQPAARYERLE
jgi:hypothetical protein